MLFFFFYVNFLLKDVEYRIVVSLFIYLFFVFGLVGFGNLFKL